MRVLASVLSALTPKLPLFAVDPSLVSRDPAVVKAYVDDPVVYHGKLPVRTISELAGAVGAFPARVGAITIPTLIMYGTEDKLAPPAGSVMLSERIAATDKTLIPYEGLYHEILNEPEQQQVWTTCARGLARTSASARLGSFVALHTVTHGAPDAGCGASALDDQATPVVEHDDATVREPLAAPSGPLSTAALLRISASTAVGASAVACTTPVNAGRPLAGSSR